MPTRSARSRTLDVSGVATREDLHVRLAKVFRFPAYYGRNWDAFDECIRDVRVPMQVTVVGVNRLRERLPREAALLVSGLESFAAEAPQRRIEWVDGDDGVDGPT